MAKLSLLLAGVAGVSAYVAAPAGDHSQELLGSVTPSRFNCELPPILDPTGDGLPSANDLFSSKSAREQQVRRLQDIVRVPSISYDDLGPVGEDERWAPFYDLHDVLKATFPTVHKRAHLEKINTLGLLYTIQGSDTDLKPVLLMAHQDVVPVADASTWKYPPFDAVYDGDYIWGRGTSDDKNSLTAVLSAFEALLSSDDWVPKRTFVLAFGFDEECSGFRGAGEIGAYLKLRYGEDSFAAILDEGGLGLHEIGNALYVLPGVTEKGHINIFFELDVVGGHSSIPFPHTGIGIIAEIISELEAHPFKAELIEDGPVHNHLQCQARHSPEVYPDLTKLVQQGDLEGITHWLVRAGRDTQYIVQTSQAADIISGGQKINAMPEKTLLGVNYRVAHHNSLAEVQHNAVRRVSRIVKKYGLTLKPYEGDDEYQKYAADFEFESESEAEPKEVIDYKGTLVLTTQGKFHPSPISPTSGPAWDVLAGTIRHSFAFDNGTVVPSGEIMTGNTDTRHYIGLSENIWRFTPDRYHAENNIHTIDEHARVDGHIEMLKFYYNFVRNFDAAKL
ncbi:acetylornithine deacetylase [Trichoderma arundinaceum]|uniref:Acetylornithine deacetylase n=1 Tax=Trichoderma arundinaceum TaxID=490622 RepID=A0A395NYE4_TRIAR|nr:acetylornithine deacetylase [Trichoderma arundinaceum]